MSTAQNHDKHKCLTFVTAVICYYSTDIYMFVLVAQLCPALCNLMGYSESTVFGTYGALAQCWSKEFYESLNQNLFLRFTHLGS